MWGNDQSSNPLYHADITTYPDVYRKNCCCGSSVFSNFCVKFIQFRQKLIRNNLPITINRNVHLEQYGITLLKRIKQLKFTALDVASPTNSSWVVVNLGRTRWPQCGCGAAFTCCWELLRLIWNGCRRAVLSVRMDSCTGTLTVSDRICGRPCGLRQS